MTQHWLSIAVIEREARDPARLEAPAGLAMMGEDIIAAHASSLPVKLTASCTPSNRCCRLHSPEPP